MLVLAAAAAHAEPDDAARAKALFDEGRALAKAGRFGDACERFDTSFALDAQTGTEVNLADCLEHVGQLLRAWQRFDAAAAASLVAGNTTRAKFARDRADAIEPRLAMVILHVAEPTLAGLSLSIDGRPVSRDVREHAQPGELAIRATAPGRKEFRTSVIVTAGAMLEVTVPELEPIEAPPSPPPPRAPPPKSEPVVAATIVGSRRARDRVRAAWLLAGIGGASGLTGISLAAYARHEWDRAVAANDIAAANHDVHIADVGTGFGVASIACFAAAAIVYFTAPRELVTVTPTAGAGTLGLAAVGRF